MATLSKRKTGSRILQFADPKTGERRTLGIGTMSEKHARGIQVHVESLVDHKAHGAAIPAPTVAWLAEAPDRLHKKLAALKLVEPRTATASIGLRDFCDQYIKGRTDLKAGSRTNLEQVRNSLSDFFGAGKPIASITPAGAADYRRNLVGRYATATVAMHVKRTKQFMNDAVDRGLISENPFRKLKAGSQVNEERNVYVPAADIEAVITACPNTEWRLVFALARFGGLRTPSECRLLKWADVNWERSRFTVTSPKTEHHAGKDKRVVPIFPDLYPHLREAFEQAEPGAVYVLPTLRGENLATTGQKIIARAAVPRWPRTWQNLRASCETDLADKFPLKVVCTWIGNSPVIAAKHYLHVKEEHYQEAAKALQNALRQGAAGSGTERKQSENRSEVPATTELALPQVGGELRELSPADLQESHRALQKALHAKIRAEAAKYRRLSGQSRRQLVTSRRKRGVH